MCMCICICFTVNFYCVTHQQRQRLLRYVQSFFRDLLPYTITAVCAIAMQAANNGPTKTYGIGHVHSIGTTTTSPLSLVDLPLPFIVVLRCCHHHHLLSPLYLTV